MQKRILLTAVSLLCLHVSVSQAESFKGPYVAVQGGVGFAKGGAVSNSVKARGGILGLAVGYNQPVSDNIVVGLEVYAASHQYKGSENNTVTVGALTSQNTTSITPQSHVGIAAKLGYKVTPTTMVYGTAGLERVNVSRRSEATVAGLGSNVISDKVNVTTAVLGVGIETKLSEKLSARVSYERSLPKNVANIRGTKDHKWSFQRLMFGVAYHF